MNYERSKKPDEYYLITTLCLRWLAYPAAWLAARAGLSPNALTLAGGAVWIVSIPVTLAAGWAFRSGGEARGWVLLLVAVALWHLGVMLDVADGSLARMTGRSSQSGYYLDFSFHLIFNPMFLAAIGAMLFLATDRMTYLVLGLLSTCANWGLSFSAKEHVLCEAVAKGHLHPDSLPEETRYAVFIDSPGERREAGTKRSGRALVRALVQEYVCFPGQYTLFGVLICIDFVLRFATSWPPMPVLQAGFLAVSIILIARVPFRIRREFLTMRKVDHVA